jgi:4-aminobutyrate aminotransferase-like enzyme
LVETRPAAVIIEPVQGAAGFLIPPADFLTTVRDMTRRYDVLLIADEIQVGLGRLGRFYGFPNHSGAPDVVLLSKSLAGGVYPLSAVIARADLFPRVNPASRAFFQATFSNSPFGCRIALDLLTWARREGIFEAARKKGEQLLQGLAPLAEHSFIEELQGLGCAISFKTTDDPTSGMMSDEVAGTFVSLALDEHVLLYRAGTQGNRIKIAPPLTMTEADIDVISDRLRVIADRCTNVLKRRALSQ